VEGNELITSVSHDDILLTLTYFNNRMFTVMFVKNKGSFKYLQ